MLLLQEFDFEIKDKRGSDNVIADHLSRLEKPSEDERGTEIEENFPEKHIFQVPVQVSWYANIVNYLACGIIPQEFNYQPKRKLRTDAKFCIWDDPLLFRIGANQIIRRCVPKVEQAEILYKCHASPYGGQFPEDETSYKIPQSGFYWLTLFRDCYE